MGRCGQGCDKRKSLTDPSAGQGGSCIRRWLGSCRFRRVPPSLSMNRNSPPKACGSGINPSVEPQTAQGRFKGFLRFLIASLLNPYFGGDDEQFLAGDSALADDGSLIPIDQNHIDKPITCRQSLRDGLFSQGGIRHLKDAETFQRHFDSITQYRGLHGYSS